jgi:transcriptional regulator with XRE-family HTH domain
MIMGEKIALLRRQRGWSQEELADRLDVSRQSVSKWESGGSIPDLERVAKLAQVFEVSTDYLIRDEIEGSEYADKLVPDTERARTVSLDEANEYMDAAVRSGRGIAFGVACVILCAVPLLLLYGLWTWDLFPGSEKLAEALGLGLLFLFIAAGAALLILNGMALSKY